MARIFLGFPSSVRDLRFGVDNLRALEQLGTVVLNLEPGPLDPQQLLSAAGDCDIVLADRLTEGDAGFFDAANRLVAFVRSVSDPNGVDLAAASRNGILVAAAGVTYTAGVCEWIVGQMINLARGTFAYVSAYRAGEVPDLTSGPRGRQLAGRTAGIIGIGQIGRRLAVLLHAFEMRVLAYDPHATAWPDDVEKRDLDALLAEADFVVCLAGHTVETEGIMGVAALARMKSTAFFINAARGALVDESALEQALRDGAIAGAALDVGSGSGDVPPLALGRLPSVLATPHVAPSIDANHGQGAQAVAMIASILRGELPRGALNAEAATRFQTWRRQASPPLAAKA